MFTTLKKSDFKRSKVNFMVNKDIFIEIKTWIPSGERSDFVNDALQEAIFRYKRKSASAMIDGLREKAKIRMSTAEMIKRKNYGRP